MRIHRRGILPGREQATFDAQPDVDAAMALCIEAWFDLSTCRGIGFGALGPIPVTAIWEWTDRRELDRDVAQLIKRVIRTLDGEYLDSEASKRALEGARS